MLTYHIPSFGSNFTRSSLGTWEGPQRPIPSACSNSAFLFTPLLHLPGFGCFALSDIKLTPQAGTGTNDPSPRTCKLNSITVLTTVAARCCELVLIRLVCASRGLMADDGGERSSPRRARRKKSPKEANPEIVDSSDPEVTSPRILIRSPRKGHRSPPIQHSPSPSARRPSKEAESRPRTDSDAGLDVDEDVLLIDAVDSDSPLLQLPQEVLIRILEMTEPLTLGLTSGACQYLRSLTQVAWMALAKDKYEKVRLMRRLRS